MSVCQAHSSLTGSSVLNTAQSQPDCPPQPEQVPTPPHVLPFFEQYKPLSLLKILLEKAPFASTSPAKIINSAGYSLPLVPLKAINECPHNPRYVSLPSTNVELHYMEE